MRLDSTPAKLSGKVFKKSVSKWNALSTNTLSSNVNGTDCHDRLKHV